MFVRMMYVTGDPGGIGTVIDSLSTEGRRLVAAQPGYRGFALFADRTLGKLVLGTMWQTEQDRQNSNDALAEQRAAMLQPFASTVAVANAEVVVFDRREQPGPGAWMRLSRMDLDPADADLLGETFSSAVVPQLELLPGMAGAVLFVDRIHGRGTVGVIFKDRASLDASRSAQAAARGQGAAKAHVSVTSLEEFEVVFADDAAAAG
jgi:heme-degrading monooxygenase HmoA